MENIFHKILMPLSTLVADKHLCYNSVTQVFTTLQELEGYQQNITNQDNADAQHAAKTLSELQRNLGDEEVINRSESVDKDTSLRHRIGKNLSSHKT